MSVKVIRFERVVQEWQPDWVVVVGDVNATCACSITAKKEGINLAHIESGLRSFDLSMPEEINRLVTDRLADLHFTPDRFAGTNLRNEGVPEGRIRLVGNIMIDALEANRETAAALDARSILVTNRLASAGSLDLIEDGNYVVLTLHRPSNVDVPQILTSLVEYVADDLARRLPVLWTVHPRTQQRLRETGLWERLSTVINLHLMKPVGYLEMLRLNLGARAILTDSGGLQEECCATGTPCITLRTTTERPITLARYGGVSHLAGNDVSAIARLVDEVLMAERSPMHPPLWDGCTAERIVKEFSALT